MALPPAVESTLGIAGERKTILVTGAGSCRRVKCGCRSTHGEGRAARLERFLHLRYRTGL
jgi:hypothetical protein